MQIHESIGHPIELDRVLGMEANFAGMSFLTLDKLGKLRYASDIVNVVADARLEHGPGLGTFGYDDEGVPAQVHRHHQGRPVHRLSLQSRDRRGHRPQRAPAAPCARESWNRLPIIRMTNVSLLPGTWRYDDLIADTDDAILMETNRSWSIDDRRYHFQFSTEIGWEIKGGKKDAHAQESQLQRHHHGILEQLRRHLLARLLDALGHAQLRQGPAHADHGHRPRRRARALPQDSRGRGVCKIMSPARNVREIKTSRARRAPSRRPGPPSPKRICPRTANCAAWPSASCGSPTPTKPKCEIDAGADALTRFANNTIHQNVAEQTLTVSVRTVFDGRTARATTNKTDDESLRRVVAASAALARSQPKNPDLLPMPGPQKYAKVERYFPATAGATPQDRARGGRPSDRTRGAKSADRRRHFFHRRFGDGPGEFAAACSPAHRQTRAEFSVTMHGEGLLGLGQGQLARSAPDRSRSAGRSAPARRPRPRAIRAKSSPAAGR